MYVQRVLFKGVPSINGARGMWRGEGGGQGIFSSHLLNLLAMSLCSCLWVILSVVVGPSVGLSVSHNFLKGQEVTLVSRVGPSCDKVEKLK